MILDAILPEFDFNEIHSIKVNAGIGEVYPQVRRLDFNQSWITRILFKLRGLAFDDLTIDAILQSHEFSILKEAPVNELVIGGLGNSKIKPVLIQDENHFVNFAEDNGIKIAGNFYLSEINPGQTKVSTETRVQCLGKRMKRKFTFYWFFIRPFSGLIRREMLRILKKQVEQSKLDI